MGHHFSALNRRTATSWHHHEAEFHYLVALIAIWHQVKGTRLQTTSTFATAAAILIQLNCNGRQSDVAEPLHLLIAISFRISDFSCEFNSLVGNRSFNHILMNGTMLLYLSFEWLWWRILFSSLLSALKRWRRLRREIVLCTPELCVETHRPTRSCESRFLI